MQTNTTTPPGKATNNTLATAAVICCLAAVYFNFFGWLLAIVAMALLYRSGMRPRTKWFLAAGTLVPKIAFLVVSRAQAPGGLSFQFEEWTLATSSSLWFWSLIFIAFGERAIASSGKRVAPPGGVIPIARPARNRGLIALGLVFIAIGVIILVAPFDSYQRVDDAGGGRWALHHAVRGNVATFSREEVALVECRENHSSRGSNSHTVRVGLNNGREYSVTTRSGNPFEAMRKFVATADLPPGKARYVPYHEPEWSNTAGFRQKDYVGVYESADKGGERRRLEFWLENGRLAGKETVTGSGSPYVRKFKNIRISDTGDTQFDVESQASVEQLPAGTIHFSAQWAPGGERARLTKDGFEVEGRKYQKR